MFRNNNSKLSNPAFRKESLITEIKKLITSRMYGSMISRGVLEQERFFQGHVTSPEHMMTHRILADDELENMQEGTGVATTDGGAFTGTGAPVLTE
jgi:hypothetical protein